jgi:hypothetical protein
LNATLPQMDASFKNMAARQHDAATALETITGRTNQATSAIGSIATQFTQTQLVESTYQASIQMRSAAETMGKTALYMRDTVEHQMQLQKYWEQKLGLMQMQNTMASEQHGQNGRSTLRKKSWLTLLRRR